MTKKYAHITLFIALLVFGSVRVALASSTGSEDDRMNKFSLKNLSKYSKSYSITGLRPTELTFKGAQDLDMQRVDNNSFQINSIIRMEKGNTTYVYPYKYKVKMPRFKTPVSPAFR